MLEQIPLDQLLANTIIDKTNALLKNSCFNSVKSQGAIITILKIGFFNGTISIKLVDRRNYG